MRLSKISLFVGGKHINYLLQPSALANKINELRDCDKSQYIVLAESIVSSFNHWNCFFFLMNIFWKQSNPPFSCKTDRKKEKSFHLCMNRILLTAKQSWVTLLLSRPLLNNGQLLAGHVVGSRPIKRKKNLQCSIDSTVCHVYVKGWKNAS